MPATARAGRTEPPEYTLSEVLAYLQIPNSRLTRYRRELGDVVEPRRKGLCVVFGAEQVELIRRRHLELSAFEAQPFPGLTSHDVARRLELTAPMVSRYTYELDLELEKHDRKLVYTEEAVEQIRKYHEFRLDNATYRRTTDVAALRAVEAEIRAAKGVARKLAGSLEKIGNKLASTPISATGFIHGLGDRRFRLRLPLGVILTSTGTGTFMAVLAEAKLHAEGPTREKALRSLRRLIAPTFADLLENPEKDPEALAVLRDLIRVNPAR